MVFRELVEQIHTYAPEANVDLLETAYEFAREKHDGQFRVSGRGFVEHPLRVAGILSELELDVISIAAALLHDVIEDTDTTAEELEEKFGAEITRLVNGVTKLSNIEVRSRQERQAESLRKMFVAMAEDIRVILIKLADRLHNMRTLKYLPQRKQKNIARETLEIYAPLAHRLGISRIKWELEDLAFRFTEPEKYYSLVRRVALNRREREDYIENIKSTLNQKLEEFEVSGRIQGRPKHFYSIYQKMNQQGKNLEEIYDLTAVRIIVESIKQCYQVLGIVHELWKPIPGRFKDYVAMPKSNMYQSLHTTVIGPRGEPLEIQIRTWDMHRTAEYGIAAHWRYKEGKKSTEDFDRKLSWLRQILEWQRDMKDSREFMETLKIDLFEDEVFVFTPKGDVKSLPKGATPIDFAYEVHTEIGHGCTGAKVNGQMVPLDHELENGDIVHIQTSKDSGPSRDWLEVVQTSRAKTKIKRWFRKERREETLQKGRELLNAELKKNGFSLKEVRETGKLAELAEKMGYATEESLLSAVGFSQVSPLQVLNKLEEKEGEPGSIEDGEERTFHHHRVGDRGIRVEGLDDMLIRMAKCCNPVPGDEIVGYITRGRGVSIHRRDCPNIKSIDDIEERTIFVQWDESDEAVYEVELKIEALDRRELLNSLVTTISDFGLNISRINARTRENRVVNVDLRLEIANVSQMENLMQHLSNVDNVVEVKRATPS